MFQWIKKRSRRRYVAHELYGSIVSQAREPAFYRSFGVPDTVGGRYEMICLHIFGVMERLGTAEASETIGRELVERFFSDMDATMREMGVGDTVVPKKMRKASEGLYGRLDAYGKAVRSDDRTNLTQALQRNVFLDNQDGASGMEAQPEALAGYVYTMIAHLDDISTDDVVSRGVVTFPNVN